MKRLLGLISFVHCMLMADDGANLTNGSASVADPLNSDDGRDAGTIDLPAPAVSVETSPVVEPVVTPPVEVATVSPPADVQPEAKKARLKSKIKAKKGGKKAKVKKAKKAKKAVVAAKPKKAKGKSKGRPRQYTGEVETYIAKLIAEHGQTGARRILTERSNGKHGRLRNVKIVPERLTISLPTLIRITKEHKIKVHVGRPAKEAA
jgi:hypothetical protein